MDNENAVSIYGTGDSADEFPVLKAFQQYIDAEQTKARKRMILLCVFFGFVLTIVISVFVVMLHFADQRNQSINDRLVEYIMKDRERQAAAAVVVPPAQDNTAINLLTSRIEEMQRHLEEAQKRADAAEKARAEAIAKENLKPKGPSPEELELLRLKKALLDAEKEKIAAEKERAKQLELEEYRRRHYPELYEQPKRKHPAIRKPIRPETRDGVDEEVFDDDELDALLDDSEAIDYFKESKDRKSYTIPVDIKGSSRSWQIPND